MPSNQRDVARRSTIELVKDVEGVRIDVTSPQRVDLALREALTGFDHTPQVEAKALALAEAFVQGEESTGERSLPDWLFEATATAPRRDEPRDTVAFRVSVPGDITGTLNVHRYLDLAPQSDEARLLAVLAEQETVRLRWVNEGVELLYRLPRNHRDGWREALATNKGRTDDERHAAYELLLARGDVTSSELPFYRRVTPTRPRRTAPLPTNPIPFFAKHSGSVPHDRQPTIAGVRLPRGGQAPDSLPSYWISDEPLEHAGEAAATIAAAFERTGFWPLLWRGHEDPIAYLDQPVEPDRVDDVDIEAVLRCGWDRIAPHAADLAGPTRSHFPGLAEGSQINLAAARDPYEMTGLLNVAARLMIVPCNRPADCVALIGGLAVEVNAAEISAVIRSWEERFGAVLVSVEPSLATLAITAPPSAPEQALAIAAEQLAFCPPDTVEPGTLEQLASVLLGQDDSPGAGRFPPILSAAVWPVAWYD